MPPNGTLFKSALTRVVIRIAGKNDDVDELRRESADLLRAQEQGESLLGKRFLLKDVI